MAEETHDEQHENESQHNYGYRIYLAVAVITTIISGLATVAWLTATRNSSSGAGFGSGPEAIAVTTVRAVKHTAIFSIYRTVLVLPTSDAVVKPEQAGWMRVIKARPGQRVKVGEEIGSLQQANNSNEQIMAAFEAAQQNLQIARTEMSAAQGSVEASESALKLGEQRLSQTQTALVVAQTTERQAEADARNAASAAQNYSASIQDSRDMFRQGIISRQALQKEESALEQAKEQVERNTKSAEAARSDAESEKTQLSQQERSVEQAKTRLARSRSVLASARTEVGKREFALRQAHAAMESMKRGDKIATLRSPVDGIVSRVVVKVGTLVTPASEVISIRPLNTATLAFDATEAETATLKVGMSVLTQRAGDRRPLSGTITSIPTIADGGIKPRRVLIRMEDPAGSLKSGMRTVAQVILRKMPAVATPSSAVIQSGKGAAVWVVDDRKAKLAQVSIIHSVKGTAVIQGIHVGDRVVIQAASPLREGVPIEMTSATGDD